MAVAQAAANNSHAIRKKVGACIVTKNQVILSGWNGVPTGMDNRCEYVDYENGGFGQTKPEVIHAEVNAIAKAAREGVSTLGSTLYVTLAPCIECSKMLIQAGVEKVVYKEMYRDETGVQLLKNCGIVVENYKGEPNE